MRWEEMCGTSHGVHHLHYSSWCGRILFCLLCILDTLFPPSACYSTTTSEPTTTTTIPFNTTSTSSSSTSTTSSSSTTSSTTTTPTTSTTVTTLPYTTIPPCSDEMTAAQDTLRDRMPGTCFPGQIQCGDGSCVSVFTQWNDGIAHCNDGIDEGLRTLRIGIPSG